MAMSTAREGGREVGLEAYKPKSEVAFMFECLF